MLVLYVALLLCFWCNNYSFHYEDNKFKNYSASWTVPFLLLVSFCFCHVRIKHWEVKWMFWAYEQSISVSKVPLSRDSILWLSFCLLIVLLLFLKIYLVFRDSYIDWDIRFIFWVISLISGNMYSFSYWWVLPNPFQKLQILKKPYFTCMLYSR